MFVFKRIKKTPEVFKLNRIADELKGLIHINIVSVIRELKDKVVKKNIENKLMSNDIDGVLDEIPFQFIDDSLVTIRKLYDAGAKRAAVTYAHILSSKKRKILKAIPIIEKPEIFFDTQSGRLKKLLDIRWNNLLLDIKDSNKQAIRMLIENNLSRGVPIKRLARLIEANLGLHDRYSIATARYHELLLNQGVKESDAERSTMYYANRLLSKRAEVIARTESAFVVNAGERELIFQAIDKDLISEKTTKKVWTVDPVTACEICEPLDGEERALHDVFNSDFGAVDIPPLHPNCNCLIDYIV